MNRRCLFWCGCAVLMALLLILLIPGCGDDKSSNPASPIPDPEITVLLEDDNGLIDFTIRNSGGSMTAPSAFIATFEDGLCDTIQLNLSAGDSMSCLLSNVHGGVTVTNEDGDTAATCGDCLSEYFGSLVSSVNLNDHVPSPVGQGTFLCTYTIYLENLVYNQPTFEMTRTDDRLILKYVYSNVTGTLRIPSPGWLCPDISGNISIASVVFETYVDIGEGDNPTVTLGDGHATVNGLSVNVDGIFGFVVELIVGTMQSRFIDGIDVDMANEIRSKIGSDLSGLVILKTDCAE